MSTELAILEIHAHQIVRPLPASQNPALVYLVGLGARSRRVMESDLNTTAGIATAG